MTPLLGSMGLAGARRVEPELLDTAPEEGNRASLADLVRINRLLGGHRIARGLLAGLAPPARFSMLDVGAASGDMARCVRRAYPESTVVCADLHVRHLAGAPPPRVVADAFRLPFAAGSFDYVFCSLFLHHFPDGEVARLLGDFGRVARRAVIALDLERSVLAEWFMPVTQPLLRWHPITLHDAPASVRAGFRAKELAELAGLAGLGAAQIRRHAPWFRLSLVAAVS
ncbi:MAG: class I SAM-dependent methyltransferase [Bryobacteraceae bacterium]